MDTPEPPTDLDLDLDFARLTRCVDLAEEAVAAGDEPFGSLLVDGAGRVRLEERNRVTTSGDPSAHPEIAAVRWALSHLDAGERAAATVYTSGEHCPMCSAAHGWAGLGRIVLATTSAQLLAWTAELGAPAAPVRPLPIAQVVPGARVDGPEPRLAERVRELHARAARGPAR